MVGSFKLKGNLSGGADPCLLSIDQRMTTMHFILYIYCSKYLYMALNNHVGSHLFLWFLLLFSHFNQSFFSCCCCRHNLSFSLFHLSARFNTAAATCWDVLPPASHVHRGEAMVLHDLQAHSLRGVCLKCRVMFETLPAG